MIFIDASAFCAILLDEGEAFTFAKLIRDAPANVTSAVAIWETVRAVARERRLSIGEINTELQAFLLTARTAVVPIGPRESEAALDAYARFGKGVHPARLNMGDCFAYACARTHGAALLYKGEDFGQTDVRSAI